MSKVLEAKRLGGVLDATIQGKGWDQTRFARVLGLHPSAVNRWIKGRVQATYDTVVTWAGALDVPVETFLEAGEGSASREPTPESAREAARRWRSEAVPIGWVPRLIEKVLDDPHTEWRGKAALIEAIIAGGRNQTAYGEAMAAVQRGVALEQEGLAADGRNDSNRLAEENARDRSRWLSPSERDAVTAAVVVEGLQQADQTSPAKRSTSEPSPQTQDRPADDREPGTS